MNYELILELKHCASRGLSPRYQRAFHTAADAIERLTAERDLALANADGVYARIMAENERLRAALLEARSVAEMDGLTQWVEFFDKALIGYQQRLDIK